MNMMSFTVAAPSLCPYKLYAISFGDNLALNQQCFHEFEQ